MDDGGTPPADLRCASLIALSYMRIDLSLNSNLQERIPLKDLVDSNIVFIFVLTKTDIMKIRERYRLNKEAKVRTEIICPSCGTTFIKHTPAQAFCTTKGGTVCKDKYWNTVIPTKRNNTTRISPANARYYEEFIEPNRNFDDDMGWDAHKSY